METFIKSKIFFITATIIIMTVVYSCKVGEKLLSTKEIYVTSEAGDKMAKKDNIEFSMGKASTGNIIKIDPSKLKQEMDGIGSSFTEASAFVLAHLDNNLRTEVMENIFSDKGANFSLTRTHIGACDFCVEGKYSYLDKVGDTELKSFSINTDKEGFECG